MLPNDCPIKSIKHRSQLDSTHARLLSGDWKRMHTCLFALWFCNSGCQVISGESSNIAILNISTIQYSGITIQVNKWAFSAPSQREKKVVTPASTQLSLSGMLPLFSSVYFSSRSSMLSSREQHVSPPSTDFAARPACFQSHYIYRSVITFQRYFKWSSNGGKYTSCCLLFVTWTHPAHFGIKIHLWPTPLRYLLYRKAQTHLTEFLPPIWWEHQREK